MVAAIIIVLLIFVSKVNGKCISPTAIPTAVPSAAPSISASPSISQPPSQRPTTRNPTTSPTRKPSAIPSVRPTQIPSAQPTLTPSYEPGAPTPDPTLAPTAQPSVFPTFSPSGIPTFAPSKIPTYVPTQVPTCSPTFSQRPSVVPSPMPSPEPTITPSYIPSRVPSYAPTYGVTDPTFEPTPQPTIAPTRPTANPTILPTFTPQPSEAPTSYPTAIPTSFPTPVPTFTYRPTSPTVVPTIRPTRVPSYSPSAAPSTSFPTATLNTLISLDLSLILRNVDISSLANNASDQSAFEQAVAASIPFFSTESVTFLSSSVVSSRRRRLRDKAILQLGDALVEFNLLFYMESLGYSNSTLLRQAIVQALQSAITSGSFLALLKSQSSFDNAFSAVVAVDSLVILGFNEQTTGSSEPTKNNDVQSIYNRWPLYARVLLSVAVIVIVILLLVLFAVHLQRKQSESQLQLPGVAATLLKLHHSHRRFFSKSQQQGKGELNKVEQAQIVEAQFADLLLAEEYAGQSAVAQLQEHQQQQLSEGVTITNNPVKSVSTLITTPNDKLSSISSSKSILKNTGTSQQQPTVETNMIISPGVLAASPIVPKKQDVLSSLFRRPANRPNAPVLSKSNISTVSQPQETLNIPNGDGVINGDQL